jgi:hypothetical protein
MHVINVPLSNLQCSLVQLRQPGVQCHQDGQGHERALQDGLEG